jgi:tRNA C32,U32 (ribose-2'-O)-methylase TrmJ
MEKNQSLTTIRLRSERYFFRVEEVDVKYLESKKLKATTDRKNQCKILENNLKEMFMQKQPSNRDYKRLMHIVEDLLKAIDRFT